MPSGSAWTNVLHFRFNDGLAPSVADITNLDASLIRFYSGGSYGTGTAWLSFCNTAVSLADITYYILDGTSPAQIITHNVNGTVSAVDSLPSEVAAVLTLRTNVRGRRYRGRVFLPAPVKNNIGANGNFIASQATQCYAQWDGMVTALAPQHWKPVIASYGYSLLKSGAVSTWAPFATDLASPPASRSMDAKPDVQRGRK
jgi:hypothetical protein